MRFIEDVKLDFDDVLIVPSTSFIASRNDIILERDFSKYGMPSCIPVMNSNMYTTGSYKMSLTLQENGFLSCVSKYVKTPPKNCFVSIGFDDNINDILSNEQYILIDVANGHMDKFYKYVEYIRKKTSAIIMAGNICTTNAAERLISAGADILKVGIGPGANCTTRMVTGCGYPQLSAIIEISHIAHGFNKLVCADGGCRHTGDICKSLAAGADIVMLGKMFAGFKENDGEWVSDTGEVMDIDKHPDKSSLKLIHYGMSSDYAMQKHYGEILRYRASEGMVTQIPYQGNITDRFRQIKGAISSCCSYIGAKNIKDISKCATFCIRRR